MLPPSTNIPNESIKLGSGTVTVSGFAGTMAVGFVALHIPLMPVALQVPLPSCDELRTSAW